MSFLIRSEEKKRQLMNEAIELLMDHKNNNFDLQKTNWKFFTASKKYDINLKKLKIGDLL